MKGTKPRSIFSQQTCFWYATLQKDRGETIRNAFAFGNFLFSTGVRDGSILREVLKRKTLLTVLGNDRGKEGTRSKKS